MMMGFNSGGFNSGLDIGKSYYVATANPAPDHPALQGDIDADLVVVGGGCTGCPQPFTLPSAG
jgi:gamma-glutamylputrescine oxidase